MGSHIITHQETAILGGVYIPRGAAWSEKSGRKDTGPDLTVASVALGQTIDPETLEDEAVRDLTDYRTPEMIMGDTYGQQ